MLDYANEKKENMDLYILGKSFGVAVASYLLSELLTADGKPA